MPTLSEHWTWSESRHKLEKLLSTPFAQFSGQGLLGQANTLLAWMKTAEAGRSPDCLKVESVFLVHMRAKMALFCRAKDAQDQTIVGKPALDNEFKKLDANKMIEEGVTLEELKRVACFKWMLDAEQLKAF